MEYRASADSAKTTYVNRYGYQASTVVYIEDLEPLVAGLDLNWLRKTEMDGNRIYLSSGQPFRLQTSAQVLSTLYKGVRLASEYGLRPAGFVYLGNYDGPLSVEPNVTIRELVAKAYARGVGVGSFRSAVELYRFDDPLYNVSSLATGRTLLTGADKRAINVNLTPLSAADINTLYSEIKPSGNFYTTSLDWQNADNIKSGTLAGFRLPMIPASKLPMIPANLLPPIPAANLPNPLPIANFPLIPITKGGTNATTAALARANLGISDSSFDLGGYVTGHPTVRAQANTGNVHMGLYGPSYAERTLLYTASTPAGDTVLRAAGTHISISKPPGTL